MLPLGTVWTSPEGGAAGVTEWHARHWPAGPRMGATNTNPIAGKNAKRVFSQLPDKIRSLATGPTREHEYYHREVGQSAKVPNLLGSGGALLVFQIPIKLGPRPHIFIVPFISHPVTSMSLNSTDNLSYAFRVASVACPARPACWIRAGTRTSDIPGRPL